MRSALYIAWCIRSNSAAIAWAEAGRRARSIIGAVMKGKNLPVIDGVNTAGTAMRETTSLVEGNEGGKVVELDCALFSCFRAALRRGPRKPVPGDRMGIPLGLVR